MIGRFASFAPDIRQLMGNDQSEWLGPKHFYLMMAVAFLLHVLAGWAWYISPRSAVVDIPVRALNIKLGDADTQLQQETPPAPESANKAAVEDAISRLVRDPAKEEEIRKPKPAEKAPAPKTNPSDALDKAMKDNIVAAPRQYVRTSNPSASLKAGGVKDGNSTKQTAELLSRYEQLISLWIQKFKIYPEQARAQGMQGATMIRIRIDRRGNILYYALERSTGFLILDRAATDMVRRANPVPAVPNDYPPGEAFEFLIPVNYQLQ